MDAIDWGVAQRVGERIAGSPPSGGVRAATVQPRAYEFAHRVGDYSGLQAYGQSKLAQVMLTFDLAEELDPDEVTANCLHPGTFLPTKMVHAAGVTPVTALEEVKDGASKLRVEFWVPAGTRLTVTPQIVEALRSRFANANVTVV